MWHCAPLPYCSMKGPHSPDVAPRCTHWRAKAAAADVSIVPDNVLICRMSSVTDACGSCLLAAHTHQWHPLLPLLHCLPSRALLRRPFQCGSVHVALQCKIKITAGARVTGGRPIHLVRDEDVWWCALGTSVCEDGREWMHVGAPYGPCLLQTASSAAAGHRCYANAGGACGAAAGPLAGGIHRITQQERVCAGASIAE